MNEHYNNNAIDNSFLSYCADTRTMNAMALFWVLLNSNEKPSNEKIFERVIN